MAVTSPYARAVLLVPPRAPGTCALLGTEHRAQPLRRQSNSERRSIVYRSCPDVSPIVSPSVQVCTAGTGWGGGVGGGQLFDLPSAWIMRKLGWPSGVACPAAVTSSDNSMN